MSEAKPGTAMGEWRRYGLLPVAACIGYSTMAIQTYGVGPFVVPLEQEFGWSRAQVMTGLTISNAIGVLFNFAVGVLADKVGPRRVGIAGVVVKSSAIMMLATATGAFLNWSLLWILVAFGAVLAQANVWASAVASRFDRGRGLAIAIALSGSSFCAAIIPVLATWLIGEFGWRMAFVGLGLIWMIVALPVVFLLFRGRKDDIRTGREAMEQLEVVELPGSAAAGVAELPGVGIKDGLRRPAFWQLLIASFSFAFYTMSVAPNLVPMLGEKGSSVAAAAQIASLVGIVSIIARISAGFLLDHFRAKLLGTIVFILPVFGCGIMLGDSPSYLILALGVISFGVTIGAEYDIVFYLVSRHFGLKSFASLMGGMLTAGAFGGTVAPVVTGWMHDIFGNYDPMLMLLMALMAAGALALATLGSEPAEYAVAGR
ncbi:MAG: MFS transporter [Novosphingobium sp.]|nr:MFS transporter [Novosphingobium sp.]